MQYCTYTLSNGLRLVHLPVNSPVAYCGFAVHAGTRDEKEENCFGMAHFVEHMLFKGTKKRYARHILNRMEVVGGELNAYTTKEETFLYSVFLEEHFGRAFELLSDLLFHSSFPEQEVKKEIEVILDEINSYEDNPSELIYDDFENMLFEGHSLGHHILGTPESLKNFSGEKGKSFVSDHYAPSNIVFFSMGKTNFKRIIRMAEQYTGEVNAKIYAADREAPQKIQSNRIHREKDTSQSHVMIGGRAYGIHDEKRLGLYLANNILGGPGMNSRLNISLREKYGLVYQVDSLLTSYSDSGIFSVYFGSEKEHAKKCTQLVLRELKKLRENKLTTLQLHAAKKQLSGQLAVSNEQKENTFLNLGKSFLHYNRYESLPEIYSRIEALTVGEIWNICNEIFDEKEIFMLSFG